MTLVLLILSQVVAPVEVVNVKPSAKALAVRCVNAAGTYFESCSWVPDAGYLGYVNAQLVDSGVSVTNFPGTWYPDGGALGSVSVSNFPSNLTDTQLRATPVPVSGSVTATVASTTITGSVAVTGPLTDTQLRASAVPVSLASTTVTGSVAVTGPLTDTQLRASLVPVSLASTTVTGSVAVTNANLDVALSTRTKPADQQHAIIDSSATIPVTLASTTVTGTVTTTAVTDTQLRASAVTVRDQGVDPNGTARTILTDTTGAIYVIVPPALPNPLIPRCNPVRRTGCLP